MAKRPVDYTAQMQATEQRRRLQEQKQQEQAALEQKLRQRQASSYGQAVLEIFGPRLTIDTLAGVLLDGQERLHANPGLDKEWAARGKAYFQPKGTSPRKQPARAAGAAGNRPAAPLAPEPTCPRPAPPPGMPDLLNGSAADRAGTGAPGQGSGDDRQP